MYAWLRPHSKIPVIEQRRKPWKHPKPGLYRAPSNWTPGEYQQLGIGVMYLVSDIRPMLESRQEIFARYKILVRNHAFWNRPGLSQLKIESRMQISSSDHINTSQSVRSYALSAMIGPKQECSFAIANAIVEEKQTWGYKQNGVVRRSSRLGSNFRCPNRQSFNEGIAGECDSWQLKEWKEGDGELMSE